VCTLATWQAGRYSLAAPILQVLLRGRKHIFHKALLRHHGRHVGALHLQKGREKDLAQVSRLLAKGLLQVCSTQQSMRHDSMQYEADK